MFCSAVGLLNADLFKKWESWNNPNSAELVQNDLNIEIKPTRSSVIFSEFTKTATMSINEPYSNHERSGRGSNGFCYSQRIN